MYAIGITCGVVSLTINIVNLALICLSFFGWVILSAPPGQAGSTFVPIPIMEVILILAIAGIFLTFISFQNASTLFWKVVICIGGAFHGLFFSISSISLVLMTNPNP